MITVGLDFGTHQTKVCIEKKDGVELTYSFMRFNDMYHREFYTLPSIVGVGIDGLLTYGYLPRGFEGRIVRYFKQDAFRPHATGMPQINAIYFSIWYISYILFDLEQEYGQEFTIQMGAPTDSSHLNQVKEIATRIIVSAYKLVEEVFANDKQRFMSTNMKELTELTEIVAYSCDIKEEYGLLVFPEAYACLKPLISQGKLAGGMSLMIDIGGGTTDISFFTIEGNVPHIYDFYSINKGLNYLACVDLKGKEGLESNVKSADEINNSRRFAYINEIDRICKSLVVKLQREFKQHSSFEIKGFLDVLKNRPLVYCGGGSVFNCLRVCYGGFKDKKPISHKEWDAKSILNIEDIIDRKLCPILSTAYGLSISTENDDIKIQPFSDLFEKFIEYEKDRKAISNHSDFGRAYGGFDYANDFDAWK
ncbi:MAG: hypothetical protein UHE62_03915 [Muribaculaceae bacterium]|nr:hypothetical protein [Muribaculaceae bacterium]